MQVLDITYNYQGKINFSKRELQAAKNIDFFMYKKSITEKVFFLFGELKDELETHELKINLINKVLFHMLNRQINFVLLP